MLADIFENFTHIFLEIYELDPAHFLCTPELAWQATLKETKVKQHFVADIDMLLLVEKVIKWGIWHSVYQYAKANKKYMKDYDENKESSYLQYWDVNGLYGWDLTKVACKELTDISKFDEGFIKSYNEESNTGCFLQVDSQNPKKLHDRYNYLSFLPERIKIEKVEKLVVDLHNKAEYVIHIRSLKQVSKDGLAL